VAHLNLAFLLAYLHFACISLSRLHSFKLNKRYLTVGALYYSVFSCIILSIAYFLVIPVTCRVKGYTNTLRVKGHINFVGKYVKPCPSVWPCPSVRVIPEISETIRARLLGFSVQIPELYTQRTFVMQTCHAHKSPKAVPPQIFMQDKF